MVTVWNVSFQAVCENVTWNKIWFDVMRLVVPYERRKHLTQREAEEEQEAELKQQYFDTV